jgi:uncharacterized small protein (DUF1192 family)
VDDAKGAALAANLKLARQDLKEAENVARSIRSVVVTEYPEGVVALELASDAASRQLKALQQELSAADQNLQTHSNAVTELKARLRQAEVRATDATLRVHNRRSLLTRLVALRSQYIDDQKKLVFLNEADLLFDPLQITVCPACLSDLAESPAIENDRCTLCGQHVAQAQDPSDGKFVGYGTVQNELSALKRRLSELEAYIARLETDLERLIDAERATTELSVSTAESLESVSYVPAPSLALRDDLQKQITNVLVDQRQAETGLRLWRSVAAADERVDALVARVERLRAERAKSSERADRSSVVRMLSNRFGRILSEIGYPKLSEPYLDTNLVPHVRGLPYTSASSGGQVLISLAWYLSVWEVAYEQRGRAPGLLMIDSPQKNLGHRAAAGDSEFSDFGLVENFYRHVTRWLAGPGSGAQLIIIDNTPPELVHDNIVVRFSRDPGIPPYGLIADAVD